MDNRKGFNHEKAFAKNDSLGLRTLQERISTIGGQLKIEANKPKDDIVKFIIPKH